MLGLAALLLLLPVAHADAPVRPYTPDTAVLTSTTSIEALVRERAAESGLGAPLYETLKYESRDWRNEQSGVPNPNGPNGREDSWGICQIHLPDHPDITKEEALNPAWCVEWTITQFKAGHARWWTGYRLYKAGVLQSR